MGQKRNRIEDARNELEKAYGPLYTLLNSLTERNGNTLGLLLREKDRLDKILATYPFMFTSEIYNLWKEKIQPAKGRLPSGNEITLGVGSSATFFIPIEFRNKINEEYDRKVEGYNRLLGKNPVFFKDVS